MRYKHVIEPGHHNDVTDIAGVRVGHATDHERLTGVTVIELPEGAVVSGDVRGGAPGTRETDLLDPSCMVETAHAFVFSGGSVYGLAAADGVVQALADKGRGFSLVPNLFLPIVPAAIIFDFLVGDYTSLGIADYTRLGAQAYGMCSLEQIVLGSVGAGRGATSGVGPGGVGSASARILEGPLSGVMVAALVVVNSAGSVVLPDNKMYAAPFLLPEDGVDTQAVGVGQVHDSGIAKLDKLMGNTTLGVVLTTARLLKSELKRVSIMAHDGLARGIRHLHTPFDGDVVFAGATGTDAIETDQRAYAVARIGAVAADCLTRAVARAIPS